MKRTSVTHEFVDKIPANLEEGKLYISILYATAIHKCCCGCGSEVVTPLSPTDWELSFNGEAVSLDPSIGSWNLPCQSHYWIRNNDVRWVRGWTRAEIDKARIHERSTKEVHYGGDRRQEEHSPGWLSRLFK